MAEIFAKVVPSVGVILSNIQLASPLKAVLICRKHNDLGSLNPVPWAVSVYYSCSFFLLSPDSAHTFRSRS
jgi:hypothetical protein